MLIQLICTSFKSFRIGLQITHLSPFQSIYCYLHKMAFIQLFLTAIKHGYNLGGKQSAVSRCKIQGTASDACIKMPQFTPRRVRYPWHYTASSQFISYGFAGTFTSKPHSDSDEVHTEMVHLASDALSLKVCINLRFHIGLKLIATKLDGSTNTYCRSRFHLRVRANLLCFSLSSLRNLIKSLCSHCYILNFKVNPL